MRGRRGGRPYLVHFLLLQGHDIPNVADIQGHKLLYLGPFAADETGGTAACADAELRRAVKGRSAAACAELPEQRSAVKGRCAADWRIRLVAPQ